MRGNCYPSLAPRRVLQRSLETIIITHTSVCGGDAPGMHLSGRISEWTCGQNSLNSCLLQTRGLCFPRELNETSSGFPTGTSACRSRPAANQPSRVPHLPKVIVSAPVQTLRIHTRALHGALEQTAPARDLMSASLTLSRHAEILALWAGAWRVLDTAIGSCVFAQRLPNLTPQPRHALAIADLRRLGCSENRVFDNAGSPPDIRLHSVHPIIVPPDVSAFLGLCYVVRGASLGAKVIARHLHDVLQLDEDCGAAFFSGTDVDQPGWTEWIRGADAVLQENGDMTQACCWAQLTFEFLLQRFSESTLAPVASESPSFQSMTWALHA